jgi:Transposase DDE domain
MREQLNFPQARLAFRLDREVRDREDTQLLLETRYFITSLDPDVVTPKELLRLARGHWQIENSLHFVKDRWWDEDRHYSKRPGLADALAALLNMALTLLRLGQDFEPDLPMRGRADQLSWQPAQALQLIGVPSSNNQDPNRIKNGPAQAVNASNSQFL